jgi:predicted phage-related endonuclease
MAAIEAEEAEDRVLPLPGEGSAFTIERHPDRAAWLATRRQGIGGSDASGLWLPGKHSSPLMVYADKRGLRDEGEDSIVAMVGRALEPGLRTIYGQVTTRRVDYPGEHVILRSLRWPWMFASLDGVTFDDVRPSPAPLELKNRGGYASWDEGIPLLIQLQMQHQLAVTGWDWASGMGLLQGNKPAWQDIERDERWIAAHVTRCADLWARIKDGEPPEADDSEATAEALKLLYRRDDGEEIALDDKAARWAANWDEAGDEEKDAAQAGRRYENKLRRAIGTAARGRLPDGSVIDLKTQKDGKRVMRWKAK